VLLVDQLNLKILVLEDLLCPLDVEEDVDESPDGILVATHHQIGETNEVIRCHLASRYSGVHGLLVDVDVLEDVNCLVEISEQRVKSAKSDEREVTQHLVQRMHPKLAGNTLRITT